MNKNQTKQFSFNTYFLCVLLIGFAPSFVCVQAADNDNSHLGVASCASSVCHGSFSERTATRIRQDEYVIWSRHDVHSQAFATLLNDDSKRIAKSLGISAAHESNVCLDCHTDNVAEQKRGPRFRLDDGVGCESCHGGAEHYIAAHTDSNRLRSEVISLGLKPLDEPAVRAQVCLSCHMGDEQKYIHHEIMGAGHPRLTFELDTFSLLQPAHYQIDADYEAVKWAGTSLNVWLVGQIEAAKRSLELLRQHMGGDGIFPELSLYDCHACHHPMASRNWVAKGRYGMKPGSVPINDASFNSISIIAGAVDSDLKATAEVLNSKLQTQFSRNGLYETLVEFERFVLSLERQLLEMDVLDAAPDLERELLRRAVSGAVIDYVEAEQIAMAASILQETLRNDELSKDALEEVYEVLQDEHTFNAEQFAVVMASYAKSHLFQIEPE